LTLPRVGSSFVIFTSEGAFGIPGTDEFVAAGGAETFPAIGFAVFDVSTTIAVFAFEFVFVFTEGALVVVQPEAASKEIAVDKNIALRIIFLNFSSLILIPDLL
jgi:hypothetical protein